MIDIKRRRIIQGAAAIAVAPAAAILPGQARAAAEFTFKCGHDLPVAHAMHVRLLEASARIKTESGGRFDLQVFGNNQLGGDTDMLAQTRSGGMEMVLMPEIILGTLVPLAALNAVGFAFDSEERAHAAMDGQLGAFVRGKIAGAGLVAFDNIWENGFRQITSNAKPVKGPDDLKGFKIRVPVAPLWVSMYKAFGAGPTALNLSELYSALQTKIVEGQENPLSTIYTSKFYEVQKYCSLTNHVWNGYWPVMNKRAWAAVPQPLQEIVTRHVNRSAMDLRADVARLNASLETTLAQKGMTVNRTDPKPFREALRKAGFYDEWKKKFGSQAWDVLLQYAPGLA
ncbi:TRAP transporter substrate-binding protein [Cupriavidus sp. RAF12]|uniref:TRAP transporter substrate-binding protein n=1 Tax=Cupriavidus sp. RAF12 TaxID=3233050 RepID=UPI003F918FD6